VNSRFAIRTRPRTYSVLKAYLERLDTIPSQVLIRAFIVEITLTDTTNFGMEFMTQNVIDNWESQSGTNWKELTPGSGQG